MEQTLGKRIAGHRKRLNMTQDLLAEQLGITAQAVSKWENDLSCPDIATLPRLAEIFGITTDELLGREAPTKVFHAEVVDEDDTDSDLHAEFENDKDRVSIHWSAGRRSALTFGLMVLGVGVLMLLGRIYNLDVSFWSILWPCVMITYGVDDLLKKFSVFNLGVSLFGCYFLVNNMGLWELSIGSEMYFPIIVVILGLALLVDALRKPKKSGFRFVHSGKKKHKNTKDQCVIDDSGFDCSLSFGERNYIITASPLQHGTACVSFGEMVLDLSQVEAVAPNCTIDITCSFGELNLLVPRKFKVECDTSAAFAANNIKGYPDANPAGVIYLDGAVSFGEVCVHYI